MCPSSAFKCSLRTERDIPRAIKTHCLQSAKVIHADANMESLLHAVTVHLRILSDLAAWYSEFKSSFCAFEVSLALEEIKRAFKKQDTWDVALIKKEYLTNWICDRKYPKTGNPITALIASSSAI